MLRHFIACVALLALAQPALALSEADLILCLSDAKDAPGYSTLMACTRAIASPALSDSDRARAHYKRAKAYANVVVGWGRTFADYTEAIRLDPGFKQAYVERAELLLKQNEYRAALADCIQAARLDPQWMRPQLCAARAHQGKGDTLRALSAYRRAVNLSEAAFQRAREKLLPLP